MVCSRYTRLRGPSRFDFGRMEVALGLLALVAGSDVTASARASRPDIASHSIALSARACLTPPGLFQRTPLSLSRTLVMPPSDPHPLYLWTTVFATDRDLELRRAVAEEMIAEGKVGQADLQRWQEGLRSGVQGCIVSIVNKTRILLDFVFGTRIYCLIWSRSVW
jgi:hypothetical protein